MRLNLCLSFAALGFMISGSAHAVPIQWNLKDVVLTDGATVTGGFTFDDDTNSVSDFAFTISGGALSSFPSATTFSKALGTPVSYYNISVYSQKDGFYFGTYAHRLDIIPTEFLTNAGGTVSLIQLNPNAAYFTAESISGSARRAITGSITTLSAAVPESSTWAMLVAGAGFVGASMRRRRQITKVSFA